MQRVSALRPDLEDQWRERVSAASFAYEFARIQAEAALRLCIGQEVSDCDFEALKTAQMRESEALDEYMRVLKIFHELVVDRVAPPY
jgi:hypothetical protein